MENIAEAIDGCVVRSLQKFIAQSPWSDDEVLDEFLAEQEARWGPATYRRYETVVTLLRAYLERYWPGHDGEYERVTKAGGTYLLADRFDVS